MKIFTIGYEKRGIGEFIRILRDNNINMLVDIRAVPHSRNKNYAKKNLEKSLRENGIEYLLIRELGSPEDIRNRVKADGDYNYFFKEYDRFLEDKKDHLAELANIAQSKNICLLCYEMNIDRCHRRTVALRLAETGDGLDIIHL